MGSKKLTASEVLVALGSGKTILSHDYLFCLIDEKFFIAPKHTPDKWVRCYDDVKLLCNNATIYSPEAEPKSLVEACQELQLQFCPIVCYVERKINLINTKIERFLSKYY